MLWRTTFATLWCYSLDAQRIIVREELKREFMSPIGRVPYRCNACVKMFYAKRPEKAN
jgi:hypothetical protein